jgi:hypothetical protein
MLTLELTGLGALENLLRSLPGRVEAGVKVSGEAASYALVWEWGRVGIKPGPKTMYSTNPNGEERVLTITAPHGWIRVNRTRYEQLLKEKTQGLKLSTYPPEQWQGLLQQIVETAAEESMEIMRETAPEDTGLLKSSLEVVRGGDPILQDDESALTIGVNF